MLRLLRLAAPTLGPSASRLAVLGLAQSSVRPNGSDKLKTKRAIEYKAAPYGYITMIPAGVECIPADNLPDDEPARFWVEPWEGMTDEAESWERSYGFLLEASEVE